jgi:hypothetical protein
MAGVKLDSVRQLVEGVTIPEVGLLWPLTGGDGLGIFGSR